MTNLILRRRPERQNLSLSAFDEFENLVDRFFSGYQTYNDGELSMHVPVELTEKDNNLILRAIIPGLKKEDINIEVSEDKVSISGEYKSEREEKSELVYRSEFAAGKFERIISLPQNIDHQKAQADYKDGILTITLPKAEKELSKTVKLSLK